ncbi:extracellular solute-binding protein [Microbacterium sp. MAHUQ-60]|uniref:extracellular solute-binding protein n=1 Tax=unclassified Microbacterium TaxID=2609290 RepID=UPI003621A6DD
MAWKKSAKLAVALAAVLSLAACGSGASAGNGGDGGEKVTLTWANVGGQEAEREKFAFHDPFTDETGIKIESVAFSNLIAQLQKMVESGKPVWDVVHNVPYIALKYCGELLEKVDYSDFPDVFPENTTTECTVPAGKFGFVYAYDNEVYTDEVPTELADFFDTETFPGKRVIRANNPRGYLEMALLADGVAPEDLYPLDIERSLAKWDTIKSDLIFVPAVAAVQQALVSKQATMTMTISTNLGAAFDSGATISPVWDITFWDFDVFMIPKGTPYKEEAVAAIKFALQPERQIENAELGGNTPVRTDIDPATIDFEGGTEFNPFLGDDRGELILFDSEWWAEHLESASESWVAWQAG